MAPRWNLSEVVGGGCLSRTWNSGPHVHGQGWGWTCSEPEVPGRQVSGQGSSGEPRLQGRGYGVIGEG